MQVSLWDSLEAFNSFKHQTLVGMALRRSRRNPSPDVAFYEFIADHLIEAPSKSSKPDSNCWPLRSAN